MIADLGTGLVVVLGWVIFGWFSLGIVPWGSDGLKTALSTDTRISANSTGEADQKRDILLSALVGVAAPLPEQVRSLQRRESHNFSPNLTTTGPGEAAGEQSAVPVEEGGAGDEDDDDDGPPHHLAGCVKINGNEIPYIVEWLEYHRLMGFTKILIYVDDSFTDGFELRSATRVLEEYLRDFLMTPPGFIEVHTIAEVMGDLVGDVTSERGAYRFKPSSLHRITQQLMAQHCWRKLAPQAEWVAHFDMDEFFFIPPQPPSRPSDASNNPNPSDPRGTQEGTTQGGRGRFETGDEHKGGRPPEWRTATPQRQLAAEILRFRGRAGGSSGSVTDSADPVIATPTTAFPTANLTPPSEAGYPKPPPAPFSFGVNPAASIGARALSNGKKGRRGTMMMASQREDSGEDEVAGGNTYFGGGDDGRLLDNEIQDSQANNDQAINDWTSLTEWLRGLYTADTNEGRFYRSGAFSGLYVSNLNFGLCDVFTRHMRIEKNVETGEVQLVGQANNLNAHNEKDDEEDEEQNNDEEGAKHEDDDRSQIDTEKVLATIDLLHHTGPSGVFKALYPNSGKGIESSHEATDWPLVIQRCKKSALKVQHSDLAPDQILVAFAQAVPECQPYINEFNHTAGIEALVAGGGTLKKFIERTNVPGKCVPGRVSPKFTLLGKTLMWSGHRFRVPKGFINSDARESAGARFEGSVRAEPPRPIGPGGYSSPRRRSRRIHDGRLQSTEGTVAAVGGGGCVVNWIHYCAHGGRSAPMVMVEASQVRLHHYTLRSLELRSLGEERWRAVGDKSATTGWSTKFAGPEMATQLRGLLAWPHQAPRIEARLRASLANRYGPALVWRDVTYELDLDQRAAFATSRQPAGPVYSYPAGEHPTYRIRWRDAASRAAVGIGG